MGLASFIRSHQYDIVKEWELFAQTYIPAAEKMDSSLLRDQIREILLFIVKDLETPQTELECSQKSKGLGPKSGAFGSARSHGEMRFLEGFDVVQIHAEFRALRASILKLWTHSWVESTRGSTSPADVIPDLMRFNEAIDQMVSESLVHHVEMEHEGTDKRGAREISPH